MIARPATEADLDEVMSMVDDFVRDHPARDHPRDRAAFGAALFGARAVGELVVAERDRAVVGMLHWAPLFDLFWGLRGGIADWLYVRPASRGLGVPALLVAKVCARIREEGGEFLSGTASTETKPVYARAAIPVDEATWSVHLSAEAFQVVADLDGRPARQIVRGLPDPALNRTPRRPR